MTPIVVAGGGPAGAAAAIILAGSGRPVTVIEREPEPAHRVCGEFLGADGLDRLAALGIDVWRLGARPIGRMRLLRGERLVEAALPFCAAGISRRALDAALLERAEALGARVLRGHAIRSLGEDGTLMVDRLGALRADRILLATGKQDVRGARRVIARPQRLAMVGLKTQLRLRPEQARAVENHVELMLFPDAYAGLQMVGHDTATLCLVVTEARLARAGGWDGLLIDLGRACPHLARRLDGARGWPKPLAIARVPYGFVHRPQSDEPPGLFRLGDQMGVIPSFTGDGIAIAIATASLAARACLAGGLARDYHASARRAVALPIRLATGLYRAGHSPLAQAAMMAVARLPLGSLGAVARLTRAG